MQKVTVTCPRCLVQYNVDEAHLGKTGHCKKCNTSFVLSSLVETATRTDVFPAGAMRPVEPRWQALAGEESPEVWNVGDVVLGVYEIKPLKSGFDQGKHYAEGGMGLVYRARHRGWDLDLALKRPKRETFQTESGKDNFERECATWVELGLHPNIVSCYYVRRVGGIPMVFAEFVEDGSLDDWIASGILYRGGPEESLRRILDIAIQFGWGLEYAHQQRLIHQDVKPDNVMMDGAVPKVTDFGLAKARVAAGEEYSHGAAPRSMFVSWGGMTPAYCSPEQIEAAIQVKSGAGADEQTHLTRRTDIWSFGVSLLAMFFGKSACSGGGHTAGKVLRDYLKAPPASEILPAMPGLMADLLFGCFERDPKDRPQSMREIIDNLKSIYRDQFAGEYPRPEPVLAELKADTLNNRAASLLDLGRTEEASKLLEEAWECHPWQPQVAHNRGLLLWRTGKITDRELIHHLQELCRTRPLDWEAAYSMGQVQLERGDVEAALKALEQAVGLGGRFEVQATLDEARNLVSLAPGCVRAFTELPTGPLHIFVSSDDRWLLAQVDEQTVCLCNAHSGQVAASFRAGGGNLDGAVSADGRWQLVGEKAATVQLWDASRRRKVRTFREIAWDSARRLSARDGKWEVLPTKDCSIVIKEPASGQVRQVFWGHTDKINAVCPSADGERILSGGSDRTIRCWEVASGRCLRTFKAHAGAVRAVYLASDGSWALSAGLDRTLKLWNLELLHDESRRFVSPTALCHITSSEEASRTQREFVELREKAQAAVENGEFEEALELVHRARALPGYEVDRQVMDLWNAAGRHCRRKYFLDAWLIRSFEGHGKDVHCGVLTRDAGRAVSASWDHTIRVWDAGTGHCLWTLGGHTDSVRSVALNSGGTRAVSGSWDKTLRVWDIENGRCLRTIEGQGNCITSVCLGPDGRRVLVGGWDRRPRLLDLETGESLQTFSGHGGHVTSVALSANGCWVLSGSEDKTLRLWDAASGECLRTFEGHTDWVTSVCLSADARWALSGSKDWTICLWDVASGSLRQVCKGHDGPVNSVCLSSDGRWALSGSKDRTLRLWEIRRGNCLHVFEGHAGEVNSVFMSPDCRWVLSGSEDWGLRLWELDWEYDFPGWVDWDEAARPFLETFLTLRAQSAGQGVAGAAAPAWTDRDFGELIRQLEDHGYGYLRPNGVRRALEAMSAGWKGQPTLPGECSAGRLNQR